MKKHIMRSLSISIIIIGLQACNPNNLPQNISKPTATNTAMSTQTITNTPTLTNTPTKTNTPTITYTPSITPIPEPVTITGVISIINSQKKPFITTIELHEKATFLLISKVSTNSKGAYKMDKVQPGNYDLWVLLTKSPKIMFGCNDIEIPNSDWKIGITFSGDGGLTMGAVSLSKAILFSNNLDPNVLKANGIYAVLENYAILAGPNNNLEVNLLCK